MGRIQCEEERTEIWPETPSDSPAAPLQETRTERLEDVKAPALKEERKRRKEGSNNPRAAEKSLKRRLHDVEQELGCLKAIEGEPSHSRLREALKDCKIITTSARNITSFNRDFLNTRWKASCEDPMLLGITIFTDLVVGSIAGVMLLGLTAGAIGMPLWAALPIAAAALIAAAIGVDRSFEGFNSDSPRFRDYLLFLAAPVRYALSPLTDFLSRKGIFRAARFVRSLKDAELDTEKNETLLQNRIEQLEALAGGIEEEISKAQAEIEKRKEERKKQQAPEEVRDRARVLDAKRRELGQACLNRTNEILEELDRTEGSSEEVSQLTWLLEEKKADYLEGVPVDIPGSTGMSRILNACIDSGPVLTREQREEVFGRIMATLERRERRAV